MVDDRVDYRRCDNGLPDQMVYGVTGEGENLMRKYAKISPEFWIGKTGKKIRAAGPHVQLVALYLLTNPLSNIIGLYYLPIPTMSHEIGIPQDGIRTALQSLQMLGFAHYDEESEDVWVPEMLKYQTGETMSAKSNNQTNVFRTAQSKHKSKFFKDFVRRYNESHHLGYDLHEDGPPEGDGNGIEAPSNGVATPSKRRSNGVQTASEHRLNGSHTRDGNGDGDGDRDRDRKNHGLTNGIAKHLEFEAMTYFRCPELQNLWQQCEIEKHTGIMMAAQAAGSSIERTVAKIYDCAARGCDKPIGAAIRGLQAGQGPADKYTRQVKEMVFKTG